MVALTLEGLKLRKLTRFVRLLPVTVISIGFSIQAFANTVYNIPNGDTDALLDAINSANGSAPGSIIRLADSGTYVVDISNNADNLILVDMQIDGNGATLTGIGSSDGFGTLFSVSNSAHFSISDTVFTEFKSTGSTTNESLDGLISVDDGGSLLLREVVFSEIEAASSGFVTAALVSNRGATTLDSVSVFNVYNDGNAIAFFNESELNAENLFITDSYRSKEPQQGENAGAYFFGQALSVTEIGFSTFIAASDMETPTSPVILASLSGGIGPQALLSVEASILFDVGCGGDSLGFNIINQADCVGLPSDKLGTSPAPLLISTGEVARAIPVLGSPAVDGVTDQAVRCPELDALGVSRPQDGTGNGISRCDIGAFETSQSPLLGFGGEIGLFYSRLQDGHYLTVQRLRSDQTIIFWNTFDLNGNQAWVYGIGSMANDVLTVDAYILPEGILVTGSGADVNLDDLTEWGTISMAFDNCAGGTVSYESALSSFGKGSFEFDRLANLSQNGCRD